jgi:hypothetical protein
VWSNRHRYDVLGLDGTLLANVEEKARYGFLGILSSSRYLVTGAEGLLMTLDRPGSFGRLEFLVTRGDGVPLGRVRQENSWGAPRLELAVPDGRLARMTGGSWGSRDWALTLQFDPRPTALGKPGDQLAGVHRRKRTLGRALVDADAFGISTDPALDREMRALVLAAVIALDGVRDAQKSSGGD